MIHMDMSSILLFFLLSLGIIGAVSSNEEYDKWIRANDGVPTTANMIIGYNPLGSDTNSIYLIGGYENSKARYLFHLSTETYTFLGNDLEYPGIDLSGFAASTNSVVLGENI